MPRGPELKAIAAMANNRIIGKDGGLPWKCSEDLKFFKQTTMGHAILFGRSTYEGLGRALPGRENLVLSRAMPKTEGVRVLRSLEELMGLELPLVFVCGGAELYSQLLPRCSELFLTRIDQFPEGDTRMPTFEDLFEFATVLHQGPGHRIERWVRAVEL